MAYLSTNVPLNLLFFFQQQGCRLHWRHVVGIRTSKKVRDLNLELHSESSDNKRQLIVFPTEIFLSVTVSHGSVLFPLFFIVSTLTMIYAHVYRMNNGMNNHSLCKKILLRVKNNH